MNEKIFNFQLLSKHIDQSLQKDVQAFGTDGNPALIEVLSHNFNYAKQLRCFIHLKLNIAEKLKERVIASQEILVDIFGKHCGGTYQEGLVDSTNPEDFDTHLENCRSVWTACEARCHRGQIPFLPTLVHTMLVLFVIPC